MLPTTAFGRGLAVPPVAALTKAGHAGRWQWLPIPPGEARILVDCAHNMDGLVRTIEAVEGLEFNQLHVVFGAVNDKDIDGALHLLPGYAQYAFCAAQIPRAMPSVELADRAASVGLNGQAFESVSAAMEASVAQAQERDVIAVLGSVFIAGEVLAWSAAR